MEEQVRYVTEYVDNFMNDNSIGNEEHDKGGEVRFLDALIAELTKLRSEYALLWVQSE